MPRRRLGVALLLPAAISTEIDGLRRALGDGALGRMPPHITLVPPVNVRSEDLADALQVLRNAAGDAEPLRLTLGPAATFHPDTPVIKLEVGGPDIEALHALRDAVFTPPLERPLTWPFVPHVTLADDAEIRRIGQAVPALDRYVVDLGVDAVTLLEETSGRQWQAIADVALGAPTEIGRGSLPASLHRSTIVDPVAQERLALEQRPTSLVITATRDGEVLGVVAGRKNGDRMVLEVCTVHAANRGEGVGTNLMRQFLDDCRHAGAAEVVLGPLMPGQCAFTDGFGFRHGTLTLVS